MLLAWALAAELERMGAFDDAFIAANVLGLRRVHGDARATGRWRARRRPAGCARSRSSTFAQWLAEADPLVFAPGNGLERGRNGGSVIRALIALPALLGKLGKGSGIVLGAGNAFPKTLARLQRPDLAPAGHAHARTCSMSVGTWPRTTSIRRCARCSSTTTIPIVVHPDQNRMRRGLAREDVFAVGIDVAMTESMAHCDIVLPAATHFEYADLYAAYGHHWLQRAEAVIPPRRRITAEYRDLPPPGGALRLRRSVLQGDATRN